MQANEIMGAIITGGREENSFMTMQMMSVFSEGALDMYLLNEWGAAKRTLPSLHTTSISILSSMPWAELSTLGRAHLMLISNNCQHDDHK